MEKLIRTPSQVREKIEGWLLRYMGKEKDQFNGTETFTLYSKISPAHLSNLEGAMPLNDWELPVLVLVGDHNFIVNTTQRFIHLSGSSIESLYYPDFLSHLGFTSIAGKHVSQLKGIKLVGGFQEFGLKTKSGKIIYWTIPMGEPGFAFWNVTNKCEVIGRRFLIQPE